MNPTLFKASYQRKDVRGGKIYLPTLVFMNGQAMTILRGVFKTATKAQERSERFLATWKRWHAIWDRVVEDRAHDDHVAAMHEVDAGKVLSEVQG